MELFKDSKCVFKVPIRLHMYYKTRRLLLSKKESHVLFLYFDFNPTNDNQSLMNEFAQHTQNWYQLGYINIKEKDGNFKILPVDTVEKITIELSNTTMVVEAEQVENADSNVIPFGSLAQ